MIKTAHISECGLYRYSLTRIWDTRPHRVANFIMLNPSTADADVDDRTIRRCIGFAKSFGCGRLVVTNLFAFRTKDPKELFKADDPIGPHNDPLSHALMYQRRGGFVVAAWGNNGTYRGRAKEVVTCAPLGLRLHCLKINKATGQPAHPLYLPSASTLSVMPHTKEKDDG